MHLYLYCTVVTFGTFAPSILQRSTGTPIYLAVLVTAVYWAILKDDGTFRNALNCSYLLLDYGLFD